MAMHVRALPVSKSGRNFSFNASEPKFRIGGMPYAKPGDRLDPGPDMPVRARSSTQIAVCR